jgi:hypothetical protein
MEMTVFVVQGVLKKNLKQNVKDFLTLAIISIANIRIENVGTSRQGVSMI